MSKTDTGGPAFPSEGEGHGDSNYWDMGMTLLDYFAGQAMQGELASQEFAPDGGYYYANDKSNRYNLAEKCYNIAEAMIAEKRRREQ